MWNWIKSKLISKKNIKEYPTEIVRIDDTLSATTSENKDSYKTLSKYLAVRIHPLSHKPNYPSDLFYTQDFLDDLILLLVLDYPSSIEPLLRSNTTEWEINEVNLFEKAISNLHENYLRTVEVCTEISSIGALTLTGQDAFKTSTLLYLEEYPALQGLHGSLILIPNKHTLISWLIHDDISLEIGFQQLIPYLENLDMPEEESLSKKIYWYYNGQFNSIPYLIGLQGMKYVLPIELEDKVY
jgi:hypothetical protein